MIRRLAPHVLLLCVFSPAVAQSWSNVQQLPPNQRIRVGRLRGGETCNFVTADDDTLVCEQTHVIVIVPVKRRIAFRRGDVRSIRLSREALSTLTGAAIGAGTGAGIGAGVDASEKNQVEEGHLATVLFAFLGTILGSGLGQHSDFLPGPIVYRAP